MDSGRSFDFHKFLYLQIVLPNECSQMSTPKFTPKCVAVLTAMKNFWDEKFGDDGISNSQLNQREDFFFLDQLWMLLNKQIVERWKVCLSSWHAQKVTFYVADIMSTAFDCAHQMAYPFAAESIWSGIWEASRSISALSFQPSFEFNCALFWN